MKKSLSAAALGLAILGGAALPAFAASSGNFTLSAPGMSFASAKYTWLAVNGCSGESEGFNYSGPLKDTASDGNGVFVHAKVDGYGYAPRVYNSSGAGKTKAVSQSNIHATGSVCYHQSGKVEACTDVGLLPDKCASKSFVR